MSCPGDRHYLKTGVGQRFHDAFGHLLGFFSVDLAIRMILAGIADRRGDDRVDLMWIGQGRLLLSKPAFLIPA